MSDIQALEQDIKNAKDVITYRNMALKLSENRDFKKLFLDEYFVKEAARLVHLSSDPALTPDQRADALAMAQSTGHTKRFLSVMVQMGNTAERDLSQMEAALEELRAMGEE